jgi:hypothetical protein
MRSNMTRRHILHPLALSQSLEFELAYDTTARAVDRCTASPSDSASGCPSKLSDWTWTRRSRQVWRSSRIHRPSQCVLLPLQDELWDLGVVSWYQRCYRGWDVREYKSFLCNLFSERRLVSGDQNAQFRCIPSNRRYIWIR